MTTSDTPTTKMKNAPHNKKLLLATLLVSTLTLSVLTPIGTGTYPTAAAATLPAKYDLREAHPEWLSPVRDQTPHGTCTMFGTVASAEYSLLKNGIVQQPTQVSVVQLDNLISQQPTATANVWDGATITGGGSAANGWAAWMGAQRESDYPYSGYGKTVLSSSQL
ncbi:MAG: hypothetical protein LBR32_06055, partial [Propionibacteriaceae bacterium]|nr:hypothetical protein [Propionibacteriaceae bacterium]